MRGLSNIPKQVDSDIILDSGANVHLFNNKHDAIYEVVMMQNSDIIATGANNMKINIIGFGHVDIKIGNKIVTLKVLLATGLTRSYISTRLLSNDENIFYQESKEGAFLSSENKKVKLETNEDGFAVLPRHCIMNNNQSVKIQVNSIHQKLLHVNNDYIKKMLKQHLIETSETINGNNQCTSCLEAKTRSASAKALSREQHRIKYPFFLVHTDILNIKYSNNNSQLVITFLDDTTKYLKIYTIKDKTQETIASVFEEYITFIKNQFQCNIKQFQSDNGSEYINHTVQELCQSKGITQLFSSPYSPNQNGSAERINLNIGNKLRAALIDSPSKEIQKPNVLKLILNHLLKYVEIIINISFHRGINTSPIAVLKKYLDKSNYGSDIAVFDKLNMDKIPIIGQTAFILEKKNSLKVNARTIAVIFIGLDNNRKVFFDLKTNKIHKTRNYSFHKNPEISISHVDEEDWVEDQYNSDLETQDSVADDNSDSEMVDEMIVNEEHIDTNMDAAYDEQPSEAENDFMDTDIDEEWLPSNEDEHVDDEIDDIDEIEEFAEALNEEMKSGSQNVEEANVNFANENFAHENYDTQNLDEISTKQNDSSNRVRLEEVEDENIDLGTTKPPFQENHVLEDLDDQIKYNYFTQENDNEALSNNNAQDNIRETTINNFSTELEEVETDKANHKEESSYEYYNGDEHNAKVSESTPEKETLPDEEVIEDQSNIEKPSLDNEEVGVDEAVIVNEEEYNQVREIFDENVPLGEKQEVSENAGGNSQRNSPILSPEDLNDTDYSRENHDSNNNVDVNEDNAKDVYQESENDGEGEKSEDKEEINRNDDINTTETIPSVELTEKNDNIIESNETTVSKDGQSSEDVNQNSTKYTHPMATSKVSNKRIFKKLDPENKPDIHKVIPSKRPLQLSDKAQENLLKYIKDASKRKKTIGNIFQKLRDTTERHKWFESLDVEISTLESQNTWTEVVVEEDEVTNKNVIPTLWLLNKKLNHNNDEIFKSRLVCRGDLQNYDGETYAHTLSQNIFLSVLSIAAQQNLQIHQLDIKSAYVSADIDEEVYIKPPYAYKVKSKVSSNQRVLLRLNKSLYGLKQSGRQFAHHLRGILLKLGFIENGAYPCVYKIKFKGKLCYLVNFVDDLILVGTEKFKNFVLQGLDSQKLQVKDLQPTKETVGDDTTNIASSFILRRKVIGIEIEEHHKNGTRNLLKLHQTPYIEKLLKKFRTNMNLNKEHPPNYYIQDEYVKVNEDDHKQRVNRAQEIIGSLLYLACHTRPDIHFHVNYLAQLQQKPSNKVFYFMEYLLSYLESTKNKGITFYHKKIVKQDNKLKFYTDASYAAEPQYKSTSGIIGYYAGGPIIWSTEVFSFNVLSPAEAELVAVVDGIKANLFMQRLYEFLLDEKFEKSLLLSDSTAAINMLKREDFNKKNRHFNIRLSYARNQLKSGSFEIDYIDTKSQVADLLTKPASAEQFLGLNSKMIS